MSRGQWIRALTLGSWGVGYLDAADEASRP